MKKSILVYGPPKSGKTQNAKRIAEILGLTKIVDEFVPDSPVEEFDTLYLTNGVEADTTGYVGRSRNKELVTMKCYPIEKFL